MYFCDGGMEEGQMSPDQQREMLKELLLEYEDRCREERILRGKVQDIGKTLSGPIIRMQSGEINQVDYEVLTGIPEILPIIADYLETAKRVSELSRRKQALGY
jgi:hypothetical protein